MKVLNERSARNGSLFLESSVLRAKATVGDIASNCKLAVGDNGFKGDKS